MRQPCVFNHVTVVPTVIASGAFFAPRGDPYDAKISWIATAGIKQKHHPRNDDKLHITELNIKLITYTYLFHA